LGISMVTEKPPLIITSSPAEGGKFPPQVEEELQLPDWELVLVKENTFDPMNKSRTSKMSF
jgi:hypothetical protein